MQGVQPTDCGMLCTGLFWFANQVQSPQSSCYAVMLRVLTYVAYFPRSAALIEVT